MVNQWISRLAGVMINIGALFASFGAQAADVITIGQTGPSSPIHWPMYLAQARGVFKDLGIELQFIPIDSSAGVLQQLAAGNLTFAVSGPFDALRAIDKGAALTILRVEVEAATYEVLAKPSIKKLTDLKGKLVMVGGAKDITRYYFERMAAPQGLKSGDYDFVYAGATSARFAALQSGSIDATMLATPFNFRAKTAGFTSLGYPISADNNIPFAVISANRDWARAHSALVSRFLQGFAKGVDIFFDDASRQEAIDIIKNEVKADPTEAAQTYDVYRSLPTFDRVGAIADSGLDAVIQQMKQDHELDGSTDLGRFIDPELTASKAKPY